VTGRVKAYAMSAVEHRAQTLYESGVPWDQALDQAEREVYGHEPAEPDDDRP
jgi:hypothetical protein